MAEAIYLDYAAATPLDKTVLAAMQPYFAEQFFNPSANYLAAKKVRMAVDQARAEVASLLAVRPAEVTFTAGGTEANNLAIKGVAQRFPGAHIVMTALEHDSVREPVAQLVRHGWRGTEVNPRPDGVIDPQAILKAVRDDTVLVSVMYANNEIGTVQPLSAIAHGLESIRTTRKQTGNNLPLYFHTDACQAGNYLTIAAHRLGVDLMTLNGGKIYGPKQSGILYVAAHVELEPLISGGGQELNRRSGTENIAAIIGFAKALGLAQAKRKEEVQRLQALQQHFIELLEQKIPNVIINGSRKHRLPNNVHVTIPSSDNERLLFALDEAGIQAAAGSACSASSQEPSHVLKAIGRSDVEARASLRFSLGRPTSSAQLTKTVETLAKILE